MRKIFGMALVGLSLTGCAGLQAVDLLFLSAQKLNPPLKFVSPKKIDPIVNQRVYAAKFEPSWAVGQRKCGAEGVVVDYVRDWDILDEETGLVIHKADSEKIYSQAILLHTLKCVGQPVKQVLRVTDRSSIIFGKSSKISYDEAIQTWDYFELKDPSRYLWMAQVINTIQKEATTNPAAQDFLDNVKIGEDGLPIKYEISEDTQKE